MWLYCAKCFPLSFSDGKVCVSSYLIEIRRLAARKSQVLEVVKSGVMRIADSCNFIKTLCDKDFARKSRDNIFKCTFLDIVLASILRGTPYEFINGASDRGIERVQLNFAIVCYMLSCSYERSDRRAAAAYEKLGDIIISETGLAFCNSLLKKLNVSRGGALTDEDAICIYIIIRRKGFLKT